MLTSSTTAREHMASIYASGCHLRESHNRSYSMRRNSLISSHQWPKLHSRTCKNDNIQHTQACLNSYFLLPDFDLLYIWYPENKVVHSILKLCLLHLYITQAVQKGTVVLHIWKKVDQGRVWKWFSTKFMRCSDCNKLCEFERKPNYKQNLY
jgi:hypothetical protein